MSSSLRAVLPPASDSVHACAQMYVVTIQMVAQYPMSSAPLFYTQLLVSVQIIQLAKCAILVVRINDFSSVKGYLSCNSCSLII